MDLELSETQTLLRDTVRGFLEREVPYDRVRRCEQEGNWDEALWKSIVEQGWIALAVSEANGGGAGSLTDVGLLVEEFARRAAVVPVLEVIAAARVIEDHAGPGGAELVAALISGGAVPVPALFADERHAPRVEGRALRGGCPFVDYAQVATHHLVAARDEGGPGLFVVDVRAGAVQSRPLRSIGRTPVAAVRYDAAPCIRIGGATACADLLRLGRALSAVECLGAMQQALDMTVAYAKVREQFGKPIGTFQAVRHHAANMALRVAAVRMLAYEALDALDAGTASDDLVAAAKASASLAAPEVTMLAHQIHGGNGVIEENDLYFFTLRAKDRSLAWGSSEECIDALAAGVDQPIEWL